MTIVVIGLGSSIAITAIWASQLLTAVPAFSKSGRYASVQQRMSNGQYAWLQHDQFHRLKDSAAGPFEAIAGYTKDVGVLDRGRNDRFITGEAVTGNYFSTLGVGVELGRALGEPDDSVSSPPNAVISYDLWQSHFQGASDVVGRQMQLAPAMSGPVSTPGATYNIVGVASRAFRGAVSPWERTSYWVTLNVRALDYRCDEPSAPKGWFIGTIGKIHSDATIRQAEAFVSGVLSQRPPKSTGFTAVTPFIVRESGGYRLPFDRRGQLLPDRVALTLQILSACVLLIAAVNVGGMLLARAEATIPETAVRSMLGAGPWQVLRPLALEVLLLSVAGAGLGLGLSNIYVSYFATTFPPEVGQWASRSSVLLDPRFSRSVYLSVVVVSLLVAALAAIVPARFILRSRLHAFATFGTARPVTASKAGRWLVAPQAALSVMLLSPAFGLGWDLLAQESASLGYRTEDTAFVEFSVPRPPACEQSEQSAATFAAERRSLAQRLKGRLDEVDGLQPAISLALPTVESRAWIRLKSPADVNRYVYATSISSGYFDLLGIRLVAGRNFDRRDQASSEPVAVVSRSLADMVDQKSGPVGQHIAFHTPGSPLPKRWMTIVGVVEDVRTATGGGSHMPMVYSPVEQWGAPFVVMARSDGAISAVVQKLSSAVRDVSQTAVVIRTGTVRTIVDELRFATRFAAAVSGVVALLALLLSIVAIYSTTSYRLSTRKRELGVRGALGAPRHSLFGLMFSYGTLTAAVGCAAGIVGGYLAIRTIDGMLFSFRPSLLVVFVAVPLLFGTAISAAAAIPAWRGAKTEPMQALRES